MIPNPEAHGEDDPIYMERLSMDGWELKQQWKIEWEPGAWAFRTDQPEVRLKAHPKLSFSIELRRRIQGLQHQEAFRLIGSGGETPLPSGKLDWVDWDRRGRLVVLHAGRVDVGELTPDGRVEFATLIDLCADEPMPREVMPTPRGVSD